MNRSIYILLIFLPVLDMLTTLTQGLPISLGAIVRPIIMVVLFVFLFFHDKDRRMYFLVTYSVIAISFIINFFLKSPFFVLEELKFYMKVAYFLTMIWTVGYSLKKLKLDQTKLLFGTNLAFIIIGLTYWVAFFTDTYTKSYSYIKTGNAGWYSSANELSVILLILFAFTLIRFIRTLDGASAIGVLLGVSMFPMIGTKTALYGGFIVFVPIVAYVFLQKKWREAILLLGLSSILFIYIPNTSGATNEQVETAPATQSPSLLSSRDVYLEDTFNMYKKAPITQKLVGLGYGGNYTKAPKTIEMDFYDLFFSLGIVGSILILLPFLGVIGHLLRWQIEFLYLYCLGILGLTMGIAFVAGHVLFAPAVSTYVAIFAVWTGSVRRV